MSKDNGTVTVGSLVAIVACGRFVDKHLDKTNAVGVKQTLIDIINDENKLDEFWRLLRAFAPAAIELEHAEIGLGGKRAR